MTSNRLADAARSYGWLLAIVVCLLTVVAVVALLRAAPQAAGTVGIDTGDTVKIEPRAPGATYQAAKLVCDPATKVAGGQPETGNVPPGSVGPILRATRGQESVEWSSGNYTNPTATYYNLTNGPGEDANVDAAAIKCFKDKAPKELKPR